MALRSLSGNDRRGMKQRSRAKRWRIAVIILGTPLVVVMLALTASFLYPYVRAVEHVNAGTAAQQPLMIPPLAEPVIINGKTMDHARIDEVITKGNTEIWEIDNQEALFFHPFHIHHVQFQILDRDGRPPQGYEQGWENTVHVAPFEKSKTHRQIRHLRRYRLAVHVPLPHPRTRRHGHDGPIHDRRSPRRQTRTAITTERPTQQRHRPPPAYRIDHYRSHI